MDFSERLVQLRKKNNMSQEELAEKMNISKQAISKWEAQRKVPRTENLKRLSEIFKVSLDYLLYGEEANVEQMESNSKNELTMEDFPGAVVGLKIFAQSLDELKKQIKEKNAKGECDHETQ